MALSLWGRVKGAIKMLPNYGEIVELLKKGATVEAQEKIMELREKSLELQEENITLKAQIKGLEEALNIRDNIEYEPPVYWLWRQDDAGDLTIKDGPFCQRCYDVDGNLVRLQDWDDSWTCMECEKTYAK